MYTVKFSQELDFANFSSCESKCLTALHNDDYGQYDWSNYNFVLFIEKV